MTTLTDYITRARIDLKDINSNQQLFSDEELKRHIQNANRTLSTYIPREIKTTLVTTAGSRDVSISSLTDRLAIKAVEYPVNEYPPSYVRFSLFGTTMTILVDSAPAGTENLNVYWTALHLVDPTQSTVPTEFEDTLVAGAVGFAAGAFTAASSAHPTIRESWPREYQKLAADKLDYFFQQLRKRGKYGTLRTSSLYTPVDGPLPSQSTDPGP